MSLPEIKPTIDIPMSESTQRMTGFESIALRKKLGVANLGEADPIELMYGVVWTYENRNAEVSWETVFGMEQYEVTGYFAPEPVDPDDEAANL